jgi:dynein intermediate chain
MSLNFHSARGPVDLSDLVLTSSLDWTVKLWKTRPPSSTTTVVPSTISFNNTLSATSASNVQEIYPVLEFAREDVVYDARWSPRRPGVFALVDGAGSVEIWNLMVETEVPVAKDTPGPNRKATALASGYAPKSLNKVAWDEKDGKRLAVGGAAGLVSVFEVESELGGEGVKSEEWAGMKRLIGRLEKGLR